MKVLSDLKRWIQFNKNRVGALTRLAQQLGYLGSRNKEFRARLQLLIERKEVMIQQSGYVGDSMHHIRLVRMTEYAFQFLQRNQTNTRDLTYDSVETETLSTASPSNDVGLQRFKLERFAPDPLTGISRFRGANWISMMSKYGSGLYFRVPPEFVKFFGLVAGDKVKVGVFQRKRWTDIEER